VATIGTGVSVIVPARDAGPFIAQALASIRAQTVSALEVIVVDDDSSDRTAEIAAAAGATVVAHRSGRPAAVRNAGIARARGELLAFLDADDRWRPTKLERQLQALAADPGIGFVGCLTTLFLDDPAAPPDWFTAEWSGNRAEPSLLPSAVLVRRSAFALAGLYDDRMERSDDLEWTARAQDAGVARTVVPEILVERRIHAAGVSADHAAAARRHLAILRESIARKRSAGGR